jgi:hypothetical protein
MNEGMNRWKGLGVEGAHVAGRGWPMWRSAATATAV